MTANIVIDRAGLIVMVWICILSFQWDPWRDAVTWTVSDHGNMLIIMMRRFLHTCIRPVDSPKLVRCVVVQTTSSKFCGLANCSEEHNFERMVEDSKWTWRNSPGVFFFITAVYRSQEIVVSTATRIRAGRLGFDSRERGYFLHLAHTSAHCLLSSGYRGLFLRQ
jgi:hypothetical protein